VGAPGLGNGGMRREDRGVEGAERGGVWGRVPSSLGERSQKNFDFGSQIGEFWCNLGTFCIQFT